MTWTGVHYGVWFGEWYADGISPPVITAINTYRCLGLSVGIGMSRWRHA